MDNQNHQNPSETQTFSKPPVQAANETVPTHAPASSDTSDAPSEFAFSFEEPAAAPPSKKSNLPLIFGIAAAVLIVGAGGLWFFNSNPKAAVASSFGATYQTLSQRQQHLEDTFPAIDALSRYVKQPQPTRTSFTLQNPEITDTNNIIGALLSAVLKNMSLEGVYEVDPAAKIAKTSAELSKDGTSLLKAEGELSTKQLSLALPGILDKPYAIVPETLMRDYQNSPFMKEQPVEEAELSQTQDLLCAQIDSFFLAQNFDKDAVEDALTKSLANLLKTAQIERSGSLQGNQIYDLSLDGIEVRSAVKSLFPDKDAPQTAAFLEQLPPMPTTVQLHLDKKKIIRRADVSVSFSPNETTGAASNITQCKGSFSLDEQQQMTLLWDAAWTNELMGPTTFTLGYQESLEEGVYRGTGKYNMTSLATDVNTDVSLEMNDAGKFDLTVNSSIDLSAAQQDVSNDNGSSTVTFTVKSTVQSSEESVKWNADTLSIAAMLPQGYYMLAMDGQAEVTPFASNTLALRSDAVSLWELSFLEYITKGNEVVQTLRERFGSLFL